MSLINPHSVSSFVCSEKPALRKTLPNFFFALHSCDSATENIQITVPTIMPRAI
jgi:hypothetical protein